ncbi:unnamed protein product [Schistosoma curassoni]|uniref:Uncharacterized protein n=1 Tax=Schistosoma curassoni TaxID=6186 RepID=A0A183KZP9_9TREM|nr:unnamed protein product [Schistosoma curassoni]
MGDLNAKVGMDNAEYEHIIGRYELEERKEICKLMRVQQNGYTRHILPQTQPNLESLGFNTNEALSN